MEYRFRISALQKLLVDNKLDYLLVTNHYNIFYLTGFKGVSEIEREVTALIGKSGLKLIAPKLYQAEVMQMSKINGFRTVIVNERVDLFKRPVQMINKGGSLCIESTDLKVSELNELISYSDINIK